MKINFYLLQSQLNALKTPTQAIIAKENGIENNIRDALISSEEKHLPNVIIKELYSQHAGTLEYEKIINYKQDIAREKWYITYEENISNYPTVFDINFLFSLFIILVTVFFLKKYKSFIDNLKIKNNNLNEDANQKTKICPYCSEEILFTAKKCKYCHSNLNNFSFLKGSKINKIAWYLLVGLAIVFSIAVLFYYIHPICTYLFYILVAFCDPIFIILGLLSANLFDKNISLKYKIINTFAVLFMIATSISVTQNYNANMWEVPKIILMILVALSFITFSIHKLKTKYKKDFLFFVIWFFISIFISVIIHVSYKPILPTNTDNIKTIITKEIKNDWNMWEKVVFKDNQWTLYDYQTSAYINVKGFKDAEYTYNYNKNRFYTKDEINYIHTHDMTKFDNIEKYNQIFNDGDSSTLPNCSRLGARSFSSKPEYFLSKYNKNINISYNYTANCNFANCVELNLEILKANQTNNEIFTVFNKSYSQLNDGSFQVAFIDDINPLIKIEGKAKKILILYIPSSQEIREYIIN